MRPDYVHDARLAENPVWIQVINPRAKDLSGYKPEIRIENHLLKQVKSSLILLTPSKANTGIVLSEK